MPAFAERSASVGPRPGVIPPATPLINARMFDLREADSSENASPRPAARCGDDEGELVQVVGGRGQGVLPEQRECCWVVLERRDHPIDVEMRRLGRLRAGDEAQAGGQRASGRVIQEAAQCVNDGEESIQWHPATVLESRSPPRLRTLPPVDDDIPLEGPVDIDAELPNDERVQGFDYQRLDLPLPGAIPQEQGDAIRAEIERVARALEHDDKQQALGALKDLVESIARSVKELNGEPVGGGEKAASVTKSAHELLRTQPGPGLSHDSRPAQIASSALKIAEKIPEVRNAAGTGHGRAAVPVVTADELTLMLDGALMWSRWALRRLDAFCLGRPTQLIEDLQESTWTRGKLAARLAATDLTDDVVAATVGVAVGRRAAGGTFTVYEDGINTPADSEDLEVWPKAYRWAAARTLLFDTAGNATLRAGHLADAIQLIRPALDGEAWRELVDELLAALPEHSTIVDPTGTAKRHQLKTRLREIARHDDFAEGAQRLIARFDEDRSQA